MTWLQPLALLGLLTLPVIVLLHLLRERSRRQVVSSLDLWRFLEREVRGPRLRRIPLTWILILQLLAALLLTAALVRPQLAVVNPPGSGRHLIFVMDTSTSMGAQDGSPTRLAEAQARAAALLAGLGENDSAALITAGPEAQLLGDTARLGQAGLAALLAGLQAGGVGNDWPGALALAAGAVLPERDNRIIVYTDGAHALPENVLPPDLPAEVDWNLLGGPQRNQAVVALAARPAASGAVQVFAQIANFGQNAVQREVTLLADGELVDTYPAILAPHEVIGQAWTLAPGVAAVEVRLSGGDVLPADDVAAVGVQASRPIDALLVSDDPAVLERALRSLPGIRLRVVRPANYVTFEPHDLTVLHGWLPEAWPRGGVLVFDPPPGSPLLPVEGTAAVGALAPNPFDPLLADVALDNVTFRQGRVLSPPPWLSSVLAGEEGAGLLWRGATDLSRVVVFSFALADSNLPRRAAFPVLMANAVAEVLPPPLPESVGPGEAVALPSAQLFPQVTITDPTGQTSTLGADRPEVFTATLASGLYVLRGQTAAGDAWQASFGVNAGHATESDLQQSARPQVEGAGSGGLLPTSLPEWVDLWPLLAVLVLVVMLLEASLAWR